METMATIWLETRHVSELRCKEASDPDFSVVRVARPNGTLNRALYLAVGATWCWLDKRDWDEDRWRAHAENPGLHTYIALLRGETAGYFELSCSEGDVEILYFGLLPGFLGRGLGGHLLTVAIREAWAHDPGRVWVHTCSLDHPAALANYLARGMSIIRTETAPRR